MSKSKQKVLITGGAGFLAQHLIRELQTNYFETIEEIVVADLKQYQKIIATEVVLQAMKNKGVPNIIFVSDAYCWVGHADVVPLPMEAATIRRPRIGYLMGPYAESKFEAEELVRNANGSDNEKGTKINTVIVRPTAMYGEGDSWIVPSILGLARDNGGEFPEVDLGQDCYQVCYAGNAAAYIGKLSEALVSDSETFGGETFFINDNNSYESQFRFYDFVSPFLKNAGSHLSDQKWNYYAAITALFAVDGVARLVGKTGIQLFSNMPNFHALWCLGHTAAVSAAKVRLMLDYKPPFDPKEAMKNTIHWFDTEYRS